MSTVGQDLIAAMAEAAAHAQGKGKLARVDVVEVPDVRTIREKLGNLVSNTNPQPRSACVGHERE